MKRSIFSMIFGLSLLVTAGCQNANQATEQDSVQKKLKLCQARDPETGACADNNGDDINNPRAPGYDFTLHNSDWGGWSYRLTGFYPSGSDWKVRGWTVNPDVTSPDPNTPANGDVKALIVWGKSFQVNWMKVDMTDLRISFCDPVAGNCYTMGVKELFHENAKLILALPNPTGRGATYFDWWFDSDPTPLKQLNDWGKEVVGQLVRTTSKGQPVMSLCKGEAGKDELVVFQQGYHWDPDTFHKSTDPFSITVTCEEGAIAEALVRGYSPWQPAIDGTGAAAYMPDWQQTFINAKTANYCGTGLTHTTHGTKYFISAPLKDVRDADPIATLEAIWGPDGAYCVNLANRRHPEIDMGCPVAIPACDDVTVKTRRETSLFDGIP